MRSTTGRCATAMLALAGVLVPAAAEPPSGERVFLVHQTALRAAPVVVVVFDELPLATLLDRDGDVDRKLFPSFAELQDRATWYRNTTTTDTFTKEARPALLTGSYPVRKLEDSFKYPKSLFALLGEHYEIRAADIPPNICPPEWCDEPLGGPPVDRFQAFGRGDKGGLFFSFLRELAPPGRPRLHLLHIVFPHGPWRYLPNGQRYEEIDPMPGEIDKRGRGTSWRADEWPVAQAYQRHLLQTRLADRLLGALLVRLKRTGLLNEALLVVTADHGIGWEPGLPKRLPTPETAATLGWVPLFVKAPAQRAGEVSDAPAETVDVLPTIADHLSATIWPGLDGISLLSEYPGRRRRYVVDVRVPSDLGLLTRAVEDKYDLLADGRSSVDPWRVAPGTSADLLGAGLDELTILEPAGVTFRASGLERLATANPRATTFPAFFEGTLQGTTPGKDVLVAVVVNGSVVAVTSSYEANGLVWFGAMLNPRWFTEGDDIVELFLVDDSGAGVLAPLDPVQGETLTRW